jgi:hypothetical protein
MHLEGLDSIPMISIITFFPTGVLAAVASVSDNIEQVALPLWSR